MTKTITVILPMLHRMEVEEFKRSIPMELFPSGIKDLAILALQNQKDYDSFLSDCLALIDIYVENIEDYKRVNHYCSLLANQVYLLMLEVALQDFFTDFINLLNSIVGQNEVTFVRVISWNTLGSICVELEHAPLSKVPRY